MHLISRETPKTMKTLLQEAPFTVNNEYLQRFHSEEHRKSCRQYSSNQNRENLKVLLCLLHTNKKRL